MTNKLIINTFFGVIARFVYIVITLYLNKIFIQQLGLDYLGLNATFNEIIGILSFAELGIGVAISYELYKPLAEKNYLLVNKYVTLYSVIYKTIASCIFVFGVGVSLFLSKSINTTIDRSDIIVYFILFVFCNSISYLAADKRTLIEANQQNYIISIIDTSIQLVFTIIKCVFLICYSSYICFLIIYLIQTIVNVFAINILCKILFPWFKYVSLRFSREEIKKLFKLISSRIIIKFSNIAVNSTDNLIISTLINVATVGLFYNYKVIYNNVLVLASQFYYALTPTLGNRFNDISLSKESNLIYVRKCEFVSTLLSVICCVLMIICSSTFISLIYGAKYTMSNLTVFLLSFCFYIDINREIHWKVNHLKAGYPSKRLLMYFVRSITNIILSIVLCRLIGINGVILGTIVSGLIIWFYEAYLMYGSVFKMTVTNYIKNQFKGALFLTVVLLISFYTTYLYDGYSDLYKLLLGLFIPLGVFIVCAYIFYCNDIHLLIKEIRYKLK